MNTFYNWLKDNKSSIVRASMIMFLTSIGICLIVALVPLSKTESGTLESRGIISHRVIHELNTGYCLVEVIQLYECENPLPMGAAILYVRVPHIIKMTDGEARSLK